LEGVEVPIHDVTDPAFHAELAALSPDPAPLPVVGETTRFLLLFTSGVSGEPKACICTQGRLAAIGSVIASMFGLSSADVCYLAMPMFHSNALMAGFAPALAAGATLVLRRRFSASAFLPDVRRYGVTYFNYVGKPLSYILRTPARPDDADNTLTRVFGNEAAEADIEEFARRFGATVVDGYGSTEGGASVQRLPGMPPGAFGRVSEDIVVLDPETGREPPTGVVGELVSRSGAAAFEGYWRDDEAAAARTRGGVYWTGDLAYRDEEGYLHFAGRSHEWLRVDGENLTAAPIERILSRHPDVALAAVYAVPDEVVGDQVMAALELRPGRTFDPAGFAAFLASQADLPTTGAPRFVRVGPLPMTATSKVDKRALRAEQWEAPDPVWWRPGKALGYEALPADRSAELSRLAAGSSVAIRRAQG
ncbi:MAG: AMP-binding protein, partial [Mycobacteriales bacterium]